MPGTLSFAKSRRLAYIAKLTDVCPEMAPAGWCLYVGAAVPERSVGALTAGVAMSLFLYGGLLFKNTSLPGPLADWPEQPR